jgi:hypothetical protein
VVSSTNEGWIGETHHAALYDGRFGPETVTATAVREVSRDCARYNRARSTPVRAPAVPDSVGSCRYFLQVLSNCRSPAREQRSVMVIVTIKTLVYIDALEIFRIDQPKRTSVGTMVSEILTSRLGDIAHPIVSPRD